MTALRVTTIGTSMILDEVTVQECKTSLHGILLRPGDAGYDAARKVWNGMIDRRPGLIVRCAGGDDVIAAVHFAHTHQLLVAVCGGGHSVAGDGTCDGSMVIDLSPMKNIHVDPASRIAHTQATAYNILSAFSRS